MFTTISVVCLRSGKHTLTVSERVHVVCRVPYIIHLLTEGLGLPEAQVTVGSGKEAWTLGAALAEGSKALPTRSLTASPIPGQNLHCALAVMPT